MKAKALYACEAENPGEINFAADDVLVTVNESSESGWLLGTVQRTGARGLFPAVYTELTPETGDDLQFLKRLQAEGLLSSSLRLEQFAASRGRPPPPPPPSSSSLSTTAKKLPPVLPPKPTSLKPPAVPKKPASLTPNNEESRQQERNQAAEWEARFIGAKSQKKKDPPPAVASKPVFLQKAAPAKIEDSIQPTPRHLIQRINSSVSVPGGNTKQQQQGFEDNFNSTGSGIITPKRTPSAATLPVMNTYNRPSPPLPIQQKPTAIPLTASRHVRGTPPPPPVPRVSSKPTFIKPGNRSLSAPPNKRNDVIPTDAISRYSHLFKRLDKQNGKRGYLNSDEVHHVVVRCRLPDDQMRRIWALSDRNLNGRFGPAEFNIIMYLTDCALRHDPIPETLSVDLVKSAYG